MPRKYKNKTGCILWPDRKPKPEKNLVGKKIGKLLHLQPVCYQYGKDGRGSWVYLTICDCGNEHFRKVSSSTVKTCGCGRIRHLKIIDTEKDVEFDRREICIENGWNCKYYHDCQTERVLTNKPSKKYKSSGCYEPSYEQLKYERGTHYE